MNTTIARGVGHVVEVAEKPSGIAPGSNRVALAIEAALRAKRGVFGKLLGAVVGVEHKLEVKVPNVAARGVHGLEREASAVAKAGLNRPAR